MHQSKSMAKGVLSPPLTIVQCAFVLVASIFLAPNFPDCNLPKSHNFHRHKQQCRVILISKWIKMIQHVLLFQMAASYYEKNPEKLGKKQSLLMNIKVIARFSHHIQEFPKSIFWCLISLLEPSYLIEKFWFKKMIRITLLKIFCFYIVGIICKFAQNYFTYTIYKIKLGPYLTINKLNI